MQPDICNFNGEKVDTPIEESKDCGGVYTHAMPHRISVGYMARYNLACEHSSSNKQQLKLLIADSILWYCKKEHIIMHVYKPVIGMAHNKHSGCTM